MTFIFYFFLSIIDNVFIIIFLNPLKNPVLIISVAHTLLHIQKQLCMFMFQSSDCSELKYYSWQLIMLS